MTWGPVALEAWVVEEFKWLLGSDIVFQDGKLSGCSKRGRRKW
jgi:hypothetical protein